MDFECRGFKSKEYPVPSEVFASGQQECQSNAETDNQFADSELDELMRNLDHPAVESYQTDKQLDELFQKHEHPALH